MKKSLTLLALLAGAAPVLPAYAQGGPSAYTYDMRYDAARRVTGTIAPDPDGAGPLKYAATRNSYDAAGRLIRQEQGELSAWQAESVAPSSWASASRTIAVRAAVFTRVLGTIVHLHGRVVVASARPPCTRDARDRPAFARWPATDVRRRRPSIRRRVRG